MVSRRPLQNAVHFLLCNGALPKMPYYILMLHPVTGEFKGRDAFDFVSYRSQCPKTLSETFLSNLNVSALCIFDKSLKTKQLHVNHIHLNQWTSICSDLSQPGSELLDPRRGCRVCCRALSSILGCTVHVFLFDCLRFNPHLCHSCHRLATPDLAPFICSFQFSS